MSENSEEAMTYTGTLAEALGYPPQNPGSGTTGVTGSGAVASEGEAKPADGKVSK